MGEGSRWGSSRWWRAANGGQQMGASDGGGWQMFERGFRPHIFCSPVHCGAVRARQQSPECLDLTRRPSRSHLKSPATAGTCQELRWTKQIRMACSSVAVPRPRNLGDSPSRNSSLLAQPPLGPQPQVLFQWNVLWSPVVALSGPQESLSHSSVGSPRHDPALHCSSVRTWRCRPTADRCRPFGGGLEDLPSVERGSHCRGLR